MLITTSYWLEVRFDFIDLLNIHTLRGVLTLIVQPSIGFLKDYEQVRYILRFYEIFVS
jgi:hypothetical protein